jgi:predicted transposase YdaD
VAANDSAFKILLDAHPEQFVQRFLPGAQYLQSLSIELPISDPLRADGLLLYQRGEQRAVLHLEVQTASDKEMPERLCLYNQLVRRREQVPVHSLVLYLERTTTPAPPWQDVGPDGEILTFHYRVVKLWEEPVEEWLNAGMVNLLPFVPLLKGATLESVDLAVEQIVQQSANPERGTAIDLLLMFAGRAFGKASISEFVRRHPMLDSYFKESPWYQMVEEQGEKKGLHEAIEGILARRFPSLADTTRAQLGAISDPEQLREIVVQLSMATDEASALAAINLVKDDTPKNSGE